MGALHLVLLGSLSLCGALQITAPLQCVSRRRTPAGANVHTSRTSDPRMEDLLSTLAPLAVFPPLFIAFQYLAELGSDKLGEAGIGDLPPKDPSVKADPPKPLTDFLPKQLPNPFASGEEPQPGTAPESGFSNPFAKKYSPDFFAPLPGDRLVVPEVFDEEAAAGNQE